MSLLRKIISTIHLDHAQQAIEEFPPAMPAANSLTAEVAEPARELAGDDNPTKQRRYYVKTGRYVDHEEEVLASRSATAQDVIFDRAPTNLRSLFPKLSLR